MLIHEAAQAVNTTKKAIEYYTMQGLLSPSVLENGYRDFDGEQIELLKKISVLRRLGLSTEQIKAVLSDATGAMLRKLSLQKKLLIQKEEMKKAFLEQLCLGRSYQEISRKLESFEKTLSIAERLSDAFPEFYGRFLCLHFAGFLGSPIETEDQEAAYQELTDFLDNLPAMQFSEELQNFIEETVEQLSTEQISGLIKKSKKAVEEPESFLSEYKEIIERYFDYMQSEEYQSSPAGQLKKFLKDFNAASGYYEIFIPAMKRLSPSYAEYHRQLEAADQQFLKQYPEQYRRQTE